MKFYDCQTAPSPRRARIFIAEKGLNIETVQVDLATNEQLSPAFRAINPRCTVPVLVLDDGTTLTENQGIAAYLEAAFPEPPLMGRTPQERGLVANWNARCELEGLWAVAECFRNRSKGLANRAITGPQDFAQIPALAERGRARAEEFLLTLDTRLRESRYLAGDFFSMADITAICVVDFAGWIKLSVPEDYLGLQRWRAALRERPSLAL